MPKPLDQILGSFTSVMELLRNQEFQRLLENYERAKKSFYVGYGVEDTVSSKLIFEAGGKYDLKANDYLTEFSEFVKTSQNEIDAIAILLAKPQNWNTEALNSLKKTLSENDFDERELRKAHKAVYHKDLVDIISMVKHAAVATEPLLTVDERVNKAMDKIASGRIFTAEQLKWLDYIREHLKQNMTISIDDLKALPVFDNRGGFSKFKKVFPDTYNYIIDEINTAIAA